ncbi:hypothetical protein [Sphingobium sp.]|uniref:hypothetical protein n=1 Tax=Sphingobium sp. TaxID=1912891 RepID=UPI002CC25080|nr:hypothetical protein [Sphingobium sp.]HUD95688.1 hypothetical protein [Sphingobium sp.]
MVGRAAPALSGWLGLPFSTWLVVLAYFTLTLGVALSIPFPSQIDELPHLSVIRSQFEHFQLFPEWSSYRQLEVDDLTRWSANPNYINHPSLYYALLAPLMAITASPLPFRIVNVLLSTGALTLIVLSVRRHFVEQAVPITPFAIITACFPKAALVGGMVNNDNLSALAGALLLAGMVGLPGAGWWIMAALAIAGWTKLTAFIALGAVAGTWLGLGWLRGDRRLTDRMILLAAFGILIGLLPYVVTWLRTGHLIWVNADIWRVPLDRRAHYDLAGFAGFFLRALVLKWPAAEGIYPFPLALLTLCLPLVLAAIGLRRPALRSIGLAYAVGLALLFGAHFLFGWRSFQALGDLTIMQVRYYNVLWPGIALAASAALAPLWTRQRWTAWVVLAVGLLPTMLGGMVIAAI